MPFMLAALIAILIASVSGYEYGKHVCNGEHGVAVAAAQDKAIDAANEATDAATARAVAQAKAEAEARLVAATIRLKGERDAAIKARTECTRDADSQRLLLDAVDLANGQQATSNPMSDSVRPIAPAR